jgi:hypothetical protein
MLDSTFCATPPARTPSGPNQPVAKDPDEELLNFALGLFRVRGWACSEPEGSRAFAVQAQFLDPATQLTDCCEVIVSAARGRLSFEAVLAPGPVTPGLGLFQTLNALNRWSCGPTFVLRECGVAVRQILLPGAEPGGPTVDGVMHALRRLNWDRRLALPIVERVLADGCFDPAAIRSSFTSMDSDNQATTTETLQELGIVLGYRVLREADTVGLTPYSGPLAGSCVHLQITAGVLRAWIMLGEDPAPPGAAQRSPYPTRGYITPAAAISGAELEAILQRLNALNDASLLPRYVFSASRTYALVAHAPGARRLTAAELKVLVQALFRATWEHPPGFEPVRRPSNTHGRL